MPFARCPVCDDSFHLSIRGDLREWEAEHVQERAADGTALLKCIRCWVELKPGHQVTVRSVGQSGVVESASKAGEKVSVRVDQAVVEFSRDELFYVVGQPPVVSPSA